MKKRIAIAVISLAALALGSPYVKHHEYNKEAGKQTGFQKGKHELFPFPTLETSINPNIVQNPGW